MKNQQDETLTFDVKGAQQATAAKRCGVSLRKMTSALKHEFGHRPRFVRNFMFTMGEDAGHSGSVLGGYQ